MRGNSITSLIWHPVDVLLHMERALRPTSVLGVLTQLSILDPEVLCSVLSEGLPGNGVCKRDRELLCRLRNKAACFNLLPCLACEACLVP